MDLWIYNSMELYIYNIILTSTSIDGNCPLKIYVPGVNV